MHVKKFLPKLISQARQSDIDCKHAAVIVVNGKPIVWAMNELKGLSSFHAEVAVVYKYLMQRGEYALAKSQYRLWSSGRIRQWQKLPVNKDPIKCNLNCYSSHIQPSISE